MPSEIARVKRRPLQTSVNSYASSDEHLKGLDYYSQALSLSRAVEDRSLEASILVRIARVERARGNLVEARNQIEAALDIIESLRTKIASQELRASYFASSQQYFETYIDLLMQLHHRHPSEGHDGRALQVSERARARSLLEMLTEARARSARASIRNSYNGNVHCSSCLIPRRRRKTVSCKAMVTKNRCLR